MQHFAETQLQRSLWGSRSMKVSKLGHHLERSRASIAWVSNLVDECRRSVAWESRSLSYVRDSAGFESHQPCASCISSHQVIREHNLSHKAWGAVKRPASFHRYNAVRDHKPDRGYSHKLPHPAIRI